MRKTSIFALLIVSGLLSTAASARTICTIVADASKSGAVLQSGDCTSRVTPASTFKIAISLMGFDAGVLQDEHTPAWPYQPGYPDWGGDAWRRGRARLFRYSSRSHG